MIDVQVVLDGADADPQQSVGCVGTLLRTVDQVEVARASDPVLLALHDRYGASVRLAGSLRRDVPVVVVSPQVMFARGAVRRLVKHTRHRGRVVTRVFIPGLSESAQVTCWSPSWLGSYRGDVAGLLDAGLAFDREHLPAGSPVARSWVRGDILGISLGADVTGKARLWAVRTGAELEARRFWGESVRARAGAARRRIARRRQRRRQTTPA